MLPDYKVSISDYCNIFNFEKTLKEKYQKSFEQKDVIFLFRNLKWIGPLQISLLYEWILNLVKKEVWVVISFQDLFASDESNKFLARIGFFEELKKIGAHLLKPLDEKIPTGIAAFKAFNNEKELTAYEKSLENKDTLKSLMGDGSNIDLISDGDLKDVLIHELGQNAFLHGEGLNARFSVGEFPRSSSRKA